MSKVLRLNDDVYARLEENVKGFESPSEVTNRMVDSHEQFEAFKILATAVVSARDSIDEIGYRNKNVLLHYSKEAVEEAMNLIEQLFLSYQVSYKYEPPGLELKIKKRKTA
tara:strand:- start:471 stop:803 length:333 start_codon:yes stop_codon:yes gene_type:complete